MSAALDAEFSSWLHTNIPGLLPKAYMVPLQLATLAGLTPVQHDVQIWDEVIDGLIDEHTSFDKTYDLVGVTAYSNHLPRAKKIGRLFRRRGVPVVIGGAGVTEEPEECRDDFDVLVLGEAESTWPQLLLDLEAGCHRSVYRGEPADLSQAPQPRWDSIAGSIASAYQTGGIQFNRGCPHTCEFCNIWLEFGRTMRNKDIAQVLQEVVGQERLGMERVMFCTDNFVGNPRYAKDLLRALIPLNNSFDHPLRFFTELTIIISSDQEMLRLLADANFPALYIGLESPNVESLRETRKVQNIRGSLVDRCRKVASYGMHIQGSMIVGFDNDTPAIFDQQFKFLQDAHIVVPKLHVLFARRGTELRTRLANAGRIMNVEKSFAAVSAAVPGDSFVTNVIPLSMSRVELYAGYLELLENVWNWRNFEERLMGFLHNIEYVPDLPPDPRVTDRVAAMRASLDRMPGIDLDVCRNVFNYTEKRWPSLLGSVASMIGLQLFEVSRLPVLRREIHEHVNLEKVLAKSKAAQIEPTQIASDIPVMLRLRN